MSQPNLAKCLYEYSKYIKENPLEKSLPIISLDYSSLYPSLIMCYNISPEFLITDKEYAKEVSKKYELHEISFEYNFETYIGDKSSRVVKGWTVRHDESLETNTRFGLYPTILKDLFAQRKEMKKDLFKYKQIKERMEKDYNSVELKSSTEYQNCLFKLKYADTKQKALKIFMNTFYGELGNKNSFLFILELAGGITSAGQANLKRVKKFIEEDNCHVYYGDTDSLYFSMDNRLYEDLHREYFVGRMKKHDYSTKLVESTFEHIKKVNTDVNEFLYRNNGTRYLNMAYEEVLYPAAFLARKKYYGIAHEGVVNFTPQSMFIRGFEVKKRGVSNILCILCNGIMWESMSLKCRKTLRELVEEKIDYVFNNNWNIEDFSATALWKPEKHNVPLRRFAERMEEEGKPHVEPYERFSYVICRVNDPNRLFDIRGCKIELKKGDKMEYLNYAKENNIAIDLEYYFENQLIGQFARLISYDSEFVVDTMDEFVDIEFGNKNSGTDIDDNKTMTNAKKYIKDMSKKYVADMSSYAQSYKNVYKAVQTEWTTKKKEILPKKCIDLFTIDASTNNITEAITRRIDYFVNQNSANWIALAKLTVKSMKKTGINIPSLYHEPKRVKGKQKLSYYTKLVQMMERDKMVLIQEIVQEIRDNNLGSLICAEEDSSVDQLVRKYRSKILDDKFQNSESMDKMSKEDVIKMIDSSEVDINYEIAISVYEKYTKMLSIVASIHQQKCIQTVYYE